MKQALKAFAHAAQDRLARAVGLNDPTIPPRSLIRVSTAHNYVESGESWKEKLVTVGGLRPGDRVLEVGCGSGRVARCLIDYLGESGHYDGFDILEQEIDWLRSNITPEHDNFRFCHADVYNAFYNAEATTRAEEFEFPYTAETFDFVYLTSVFTHMLPADVDRYVSEIDRVLKPGGRCFASFFLMNSTSRALIAAGRSSRSFAIEVAPGCYSGNAEHLEQQIAYDETDALRRFGALGLEPVETHYGQWSKNPSLDVATDHQDILVVRKPG